jgi:pyruvate/oxaloacetate carboxyltransferase
MPTTLESSQLRPALHAKVDQLQGEALAILHQVALQLELDQVVAEVDREFDTLRGKGWLDRLPEIIREAREALKDSGYKPRPITPTAFIADVLNLAH